MKKKHRFSYDWNLKKANFAKNKGIVFSCFGGGGGSTMGYKLAGFDVLGCNEIDSKMMKMYILNHKPKYTYLEPIQIFKNKKNLPKELYNLDILDGSPPCSCFSVAGKCEKVWGKKKKFREGQIKQVLDDLFFHFIDLTKKLQPKIVIAENVKGILMGNAMSYQINYVNEIYKAFNNAGYYCQHWLLDASKMGVPQKRERVFFICLRKDLAKPFLYQKGLFTIVPKLNFEFDEPKILFKNVRDFVGDKNNVSEIRKNLLSKSINSDKCISHINERLYNKVSGFNALIISDNQICPTITGAEINYRKFDKLAFSKSDYQKCNSYPIDYNFNGNKPKYVIGMSVPPIMIAQIATEINKQWLSKL